jgi:hypothetical protein
MMSNLYELTSRIARRVADVKERLYAVPPNSVSWQSIGEDLQDAADAAKEIARRIKTGEVQ